MLLPVNKRLWSCAGERLADVKLIAGQAGASKILDQADAGKAVKVFLLPYRMEQALTLEILNFFAINELFRNAGMRPLSIVTPHRQNLNVPALHMLQKHFECRVLAEILPTDAVLRAADAIKWTLLSKAGASQPPSWHLMLVAFVMDYLAGQTALLVLYRSHVEIIQTLTRSLPKAAVNDIGFIVLENPEDRHLELGCPDDEEIFSNAVRKLRTGTSSEASHRISTCESYRMLFHYDEHGPGTFSSDKLDHCYSGHAACSDCKQDVASHLVAKYKRETGAGIHHG
ncbi:hypothetical protein [Azohydromonas lata]|uniref:Uncharacterized protein n=1 Tax=Azohydromonas lata TaxID=45677 RepID=A0ABU5IG28_9BURK|nr:hypothetical protein [Azohydromonas lata]MDZ5456903.1 hypothetical protein [Azohydromonas lata]